MRELMDDPRAPAWRTFFIVAAAYDIALGVAFFVFGDRILDWIGMALPPHTAYIQLSAVFIAIQGISYAFVVPAPVANQGLVRVGIIYKAAYAGLALWYLVVSQLPSAFFLPWALVDLVFLAGFAAFLAACRRAPA
jgi:hypothetical protein